MTNPVIKSPNLSSKPVVEKDRFLAQLMLVLLFILVGMSTSFAQSECADGIDNDGDKLIDFGSDLGCTSKGDGSEGGLPTGEVENGWTIFEPSEDTRIIYVSSSKGKDRNRGQSPLFAVKSVERGMQLLRDGYPDWLLFKRGDEWDSGLGQMVKSGRSSQEPMLFGAYGEGSKRPKFHAYDSGILTFGGGDSPESIDYLAFVELHISLSRRNPEHPEFNPLSQRYSVNWLRGTKGLHFEDMVFQWSELNFSPFDGFPISNILFRRSQFLDSWAPSQSSHAQGVYLDIVNNITFDETFFDHNGWHESAADGQKTIFNHNLYAGNPNGLVLKNSALLRGASHGTQMRSGGIIENNLFAENSISILFVSRNENPRVVGNVILNGTNISEKEGRGWGIEIQNGGNNVDVSGNILSSCNGSFCQNFTGDLSNTTMKDNVIYKWPGPQPQSNNTFVDPERDLRSYQVLNGGEDSVTSFVESMRGQSRMKWDDNYTIPVILQYLKEGFASK